MKSQKEIFSEIANKFVEALSQNIVPWQKPWTCIFGANPNLNELAISYCTKKPYSMLNQWLLPKGQYLTWNEIQKLGGKVQKGAKSHSVYGFFPSWLIIETNEWVKQEPKHLESDQYKLFLAMRSYKVFNVADCEGITPHTFATPQPKNEEETIAIAEETIQGYLNKYPTLKFHKVLQDRAYYSPMLDEVFVPTMAQYQVKEEFYSTSFHELAHSTGHASRLNRSGITKFDHFGSDNYATEELVAEMASAMTLNYIGVSCEKAFNNSKAYVQNWAQKIKSDPKIVSIACQQAEKASRLILGL